MKNALHSAAKKSIHLPTLSRFLLLVFSVLRLQCALAQAPAVEVVTNQPSPEAYDLLKDSKGYLWIAHNLGISRYDGTQFISLHSPRQNSLSMTDLLEDKKGRIWCHNFGGQIFYIENMQLQLLTQYRFEQEQGFPRITLCGDELVATSAKGLFVYNTVTGASKYLSIPGGTSSLTKIGNKVVCYSNNWEWYSYEAGKLVRKLKTDLYLPNQGSILQPASFRDTFYLITNKTGLYYKLTLQNDTVHLHSANKQPTFINTISVDDGKVWVHTRDNSFTANGKDTIKGLNLSDVATGPQGHLWMSSLKTGLCVQYNIQQAKLLNSPVLSTGDFIRSMQVADNKLFWGMTSGKLYRLSSHSSLRHVAAIPKRAGAIEHIASLDNGRLLLAASVGLFLYNDKDEALTELPLETTVKDIGVANSKVYLATTAGINIFPVTDLNNPNRPFAWQQLLTVGARCRSIAVCGDSVVGVYNDGVYIVYRNNVQRLLYKGRPVYASRVRTFEGKIIIGTFSQGLLVLENGSLRNLTEKDRLASNTVMDVKTIGSTAWLIYTNRFQQLNWTATGVEDHAFPYSKINGINEFAYLDSLVYVSTTNGVFYMPLTKPAANMGWATYIDRLLVNGKEHGMGVQLAHDENFLQFQVSTPFFSPYSSIVYQYRIKNAPDSTWQRGAPGQTAFSIAALEPGTYAFEVVATDESRQSVSSPAMYQFEILPPWYQHLLFKITLGLLLAALAYYLVWSYYRYHLRRQRRQYERLLLIQAERQRISAEIHDDLGAGLSAVRLLAELTKNKLPETEAKKEVGKIHASLGELSHKMREVIWSLNADNDYLENLLFYLRRQAMQFFENSPIQLKVVFPVQAVPSLAISGEKRRHIYLAVKEALHNCLKHSGATNCELAMQFEKGVLLITVSDDGVGFSPLGEDNAGNGLTNMKKRMEQMAGRFEVRSHGKTIITFRIPLTEKHA